MNESCESVSGMKGDQGNMTGMMLVFNWMIQEKLSAQITKGRLTVNKAKGSLQLS